MAISRLSEVSTFAFTGVIQALTSDEQGARRGPRSAVSKRLATKQHR
jgi:hypothetical protein